ncbi:hypothetical protein RM190_08575 [Paracoccus sp. CPCC 101403]|uniref:Uncharacterized protein n=1 Tax=Paracoccus broussonetiae TaxID=3075834 RepID=A0ABU3ECG3_9RHOB|nr:hypothetical protein [Paracoccus sp. CPCC 101403]MDT1061908.1 hypothetical protein [Paracoccus sp. CPCC 101403]
MAAKRSTVKPSEAAEHLERAKHILATIKQDEGTPDREKLREVLKEILAGIQAMTSKS